MKIQIITPCSRVENLHRMYKSINFSCNWWIVFDATDSEFNKINSDNDLSFLNQTWIKLLNIKGGCVGKRQINFAIDLINDGYIYVLDDDNLIHPDFFQTTTNILKLKNNIECIFYSQIIDKNNNIRQVNHNSVKVDHIDQAQFLISRKLMSDIRYQEQYNGDGVLIEKIFRENNIDNFYFHNDTNITYYNKLTYE